MTIAALIPAAHGGSLSSSRVKLSVAIVCKNNADTLGRTLDSVAGLAHEIVAVDSGSTDSTPDLLARHNARIIRSPWLGHVKTKQLALEACTGDWILSLDSDESLEPALREAVAAAIARPSGPKGYEVNRKVFYAGRFLEHTWQPEWRLRLVRAGAARWQGLDPHDQLALTNAGDRPGRLNGVLRHDSITTFAEFFAKQVQHGRTMAASLHAAGARGSVVRLAVSPIGAAFKQLVLKGGVRDGWRGWLAAASTACGTLVKHAVLIELSRRP